MSQLPPAPPPKGNNAKAAGVVGASALAIIMAAFAVEGGYVNHKNDPGGETNHGITVAVAREHNYKGPMIELRQETAIDIYYVDYIVKPGFKLILDVQPAVAEELIDTGINTGPSRPSRWFQNSLNSFSNQGKLYPKITVDGKVGPGTVRAYQSLEKARGKVQACKLMIKSLDAQQGEYYLSISNSNPKLQSFTTGWFTNRIGNVPLSRCG